MSNQVVSLSEQCIEHVLMHLEEYPSAYLALLPLFLRKRIMWRLPIADACRLEGTEFVKGIAMGEYWSSTMDVFSFATPDPHLGRNEHKWESCDAKKAIVYGNIFGLAFGFSDYSENAGFPVSFDDRVDDDVFVIEVSLRLLFGIRVGIRRRHGHSVECRWESTNTIPPRYYHKYHTSNSQQNLLLTLIECFCGALPSYLHVRVEEAGCNDLFRYIISK